MVLWRIQVVSDEYHWYILSVFTIMLYSSRMADLYYNHSFPEPAQPTKMVQLTCTSRQFCTFLLLVLNTVIDALTIMS